MGTTALEENKPKPKAEHRTRALCPRPKTPETQARSHGLGMALWVHFYMVAVFLFCEPNEPKKGP